MKSFSPTTLLFIGILAVYSHRILAVSEASLYVSLHDAYLNGRIEQLAVVADLPSMKKPYSVSEVLVYAERVRDLFPGLYAQIRKGLLPYLSRCAMTHAEAVIAHSRDSDVTTVLPNARGESISSNYRLSASAQCNLADWAKGSIGAVAFEHPDTAIVNETYLAIGGDGAQLEIGVREHWLSPFQTSSMLLSSNARPSVSIGVSNPLPFFEYWSFRYEVFVSKLESRENIRYGTSIESGSPALLGTHFSLEPLDGWHISATRTIQFGGGSRPVDAGLIWDAFVDPVNNDNSAEIECEGAAVNTCELGNQMAALATRFNVQSEIPFSLYAEYAGEDTASHKNTRLGNIAFSAGIFFPFLFGGDWSMLYEYGQWQNAWYVHQIYLDGYTNDNVIMGHWGGNFRSFGDDVGATAQTLQLGWQLASDERVDFTFRQLEHEGYAEFDYHKAYLFEVDYVGQLAGNVIGVGAKIGKDAFGERISRFEVRWMW